MTEKVIEYKSAQKTVSQSTNVLDNIDRDGITCSWTGNELNNGYNYNLNFAWNFDWTKLKAQGVESITGHLIVKPTTSYPSHFSSQNIDINWKNGKETITKYLRTEYLSVNALFEYHLTAHYPEIPGIEKVSYDEMFAASDLNDVVLVVEGKKLHVNKAFLSIHSDFFRALFSSNFKEGEMAEVPIEDVSFEDFALLMSTIYPTTVFPNDRTAEKLLALADRFLMPAVIRQVEHHLLEHSRIGNEKLTWMADAYKMPTLLEKCIRSMDTVEKVKNLKKSEEFNKLSLQTNQMLLNRILQLV